MASMIDDILNIREYAIASADPKRKTTMSLLPEPGTLAQILVILINNGNSQQYIKIRRSDLEKQLSEMRLDYKELLVGEENGQSEEG